MNGRYIYKLLSVFLVLLLLQFFLYNYITFIIGFDNQIIWLWKELVILFIFFLTAYYIIKSKDIKNLFSNKNILILEIFFTLIIIFGIIITIFLKNLPLSQFVLAFKYDLFGFAIFFIFYHFSYYFKLDFIEKLVYFFGKLIKISLIGALIWYALIVTKPTFMNRFGYDYNSYEGSLGKRPPAVYYSNLKTGIPRNQFVFERPITWGFFLVAFWPLFYMLYLRRKSLKKTYFWWLMYGLNVLFTYSRAAWGAWIFEVIALGFFVYGKNWKKYLKKILLPAFLVMFVVLLFGYQQIIHRQFSNTGHIRLINEGLTMVADDPIFGVGAGYAGPASHQICLNKESKVCEQLLEINKDMDSKLIGFNPENQFLQIAVEFGIPLFLLWIGIYLFFNYIGIVYFIKNTLDSKSLHINWLLALSIGMIGLTIEGLVLHSFVDRMIVYPIMILFGLVYGVVYKIDKEKTIKSDFWKGK